MSAGVTLRRCLVPLTSNFVSKCIRYRYSPPTRTLVTSNPLWSYEGDGKTTVTILNHEIDSPLMVDTYHQSGFRLNNGLAVVGPIALFPKTVLSWDIKSAAEINIPSLSLFLSLEPKIDILVLGVGDSYVPISSEALDMLRQRGIIVEILPTDHACTTFNFLNVEKRYCAAGLLPSRGSQPMDEVIGRVRQRRAKEKLQYDD